MGHLPPLRLYGPLAGHRQARVRPVLEPGQGPWRPEVFEEAQLYSPVTAARRAWSSISATTTRAPTIPSTGPGGRRSPRPRSTGRRGACAHDRLHRRGAGGLAHGLPRAGAQVRALRQPRLPRRLRRARPAADHIPQLEEVSARLEPLTGFRYVPAAGLVPLGEFYACSPTASSTRPSTSATWGAALHAGARPDPRGDRPRQPARLAGVRGAEPAGGPGRPPLRDQPA